MSLNTPVVFIIFKRPDLTQIVFNAIREAQPQKLFVIADGPSSSEEAEKCQQTREIIKQVDWDCQVQTNYSDVNLGCRERVSSGITWAFEQVEEAIILEDDCLPTSSFFTFCQTLLEYYRNDTRIIGISGNNFQKDNNDKYSYYFSRFNHCWGWATWKRAWKYWDFNKEKWLNFKNQRLMKQIFNDSNEEKYWTNIFDKVFLENQLDSWNYVWLFSYISQGGLSILPSTNLVSNIGFRNDGTHTTQKDNPLSNLPVTDIWNIKHPNFIIRNQKADLYTFNYVLGGKQFSQNNHYIKKMFFLLEKIKAKIFKVFSYGLFFLYSIYLFFILQKKLIGSDFDKYGKKIAFSLLCVKKRAYKKFIYSFCNPVSIVRYFEFPFCKQAINWKKVDKILDVSSPRLFFIYLLNQYPHLKIDAINPDKKDLEETKYIVKVLGLSDRVSLKAENAIQLTYPDEYFDVIISISVIEHIPDNGDKLAIKELWRVLKPNGKLLITVPCMKNYEEEWREEDVYQLGNPKTNQKIFFQRFYDDNALQSRLFDSINVEPTIVQFFGEKEAGTFFEYEKRWIQYGLKETIKDPLHIVQDYQMFSSIDDLPGMGVCGLVFEKKGEIDA
jgi:ubiquinone/menaquinone biosynthesis C-methylase UbiE